MLEGEVDAWIDGHLHRMKKGDLVAFPSGTGICHTFINDGDREADEGDKGGLLRELSARTQRQR